MRRLIIAAVLVSSLLTACEEHIEKKNQQATPDVQAVMVNNQWRVTSLIDSNLDKTENFQGYYFNFDSGNNLVASNGSENYLGSWIADETSSKNNFNIVFTSPVDFTHLSGDWQIQNLTDSKIELCFSGQNENPVLLTFEKI